jgi:hypothetical protein
MRFLVTTDRNESLEKLKDEVAAHGGAMEPDDPIPLDQGEQVVRVEGPDDLPKKLEQLPAVKKVSPDSDMDFH